VREVVFFVFWKKEKRKGEKMKSFISLLCVALSIASIIFALNGRFEMITNTGEGSGIIWYKYDRLTGRTWVFTPQEDSMQWIEIRDYGMGYLSSKEQEPK